MCERICTLPIRGGVTVKRSDQVGGFVDLHKRWIVERTTAWLNRCRRLTKDWENLNRKALAFRVLAPRINPPHAQKTLQSGLKSPDRLSVFCSWWFV